MLPSIDCVCSKSTYSPNDVIVEPWDQLCTELVFHIFSSLNLPTLATCCLVSKKWKYVASDSFLLKKIIYRDIAFNKAKWLSLFDLKILKSEDETEELASLPSDIALRLKKRCPVFQNKYVIDTHLLIRIPKALADVAFLEKNLSKSPDKPFIISTTSVGVKDLKNLTQNPITQSYWVLLTFQVIPDSNYKTYKEHQDMIKELEKSSQTSYDMPYANEMIVSLYTNLYAKKQRLLSLYCSHTQDKMGGKPVIVGYNFDKQYLSIDKSFWMQNFGIGTVAIQRL